jgi:hypothetical protein
LPAGVKYGKREVKEEPANAVLSALCVSICIFDFTPMTSIQGSHEYTNGAEATSH